jgi:hypothetical protein
MTECDAYLTIWLEFHTAAELEYDDARYNPKSTVPSP